MLAASADSLNRGSLAAWQAGTVDMADATYPKWRRHSIQTVAGHWRRRRDGSRSNAVGALPGCRMPALAASRTR